MTTSPLLKDLRLLKILQTLDAPVRASGRTWTPLIDSLYELAAEPLDPSEPDISLPLPLPARPKPIEKVLGVPARHWRSLVAASLSDQDHTRLVGVARAALKYARLPPEPRHGGRDPDPKLINAHVRALREAPTDGGQALIEQISVMPIDQRAHPLFEAGTLAHHAAKSYGREALHALRCAGIDLTSRNYQGQTPLEVALANGNADAADLLAYWHPAITPVPTPLCACVGEVIQAVSASQEASRISQITPSEWDRRLLDGIATCFVGAGLELEMAVCRLHVPGNDPALAIAVLIAPHRCWFIARSSGEPQMRSFSTLQEALPELLAEQGLSDVLPAISWSRTLMVLRPESMNLAGTGIPEGYRAARAVLPEIRARHQAIDLETSTASAPRKSASGPRL